MPSSRPVLKTSDVVGEITGPGLRNDRPSNSLPSSSPPRGPYKAEVNEIGGHKFWAPRYSKLAIHRLPPKKVLLEMHITVALIFSLLVLFCFFFFLRKIGRKTIYLFWPILRLVGRRRFFLFFLFRRGTCRKMQQREYNNNKCPLIAGHPLRVPLGGPLLAYRDKAECKWLSSINNIPELRSFPFSTSLHGMI